MSASNTRATALKLLIPIDEVIPAASADNAPTLTIAFKMIQPRIVLELLKRGDLKEHAGIVRYVPVASEIARTVPKEPCGSGFAFSLTAQMQSNITERTRRKFFSPGKPGWMPLEYTDLSDEEIVHVASNLDKLHRACYKFGVTARTPNGFRILRG